MQSVPRNMWGGGGKDLGLSDSLTNSIPHVFTQIYSVPRNSEPTHGHVNAVFRLVTSSLPDSSIATSEASCRVGFHVR